MSVLIYIGLVLLVNVGFVYLPSFEILWAVLVGGIFIARDFAQRQIGHYVWLAMVSGLVLSWWFASPEVALASAAAFALSEAIDWAVYTFTNRPFTQRVVLSSAIAVPVDSLVFLSLIGFLSPSLFAIQVAAKCAALFFMVAHARYAQA